MTNAAATRPSRTQFFALIICDPLEKSDNKLSFLRLIWDPGPLSMGWTTRTRGRRSRPCAHSWPGGAACGRRDPGGAPSRQSCRGRGRRGTHGPAPGSWGCGYWPLRLLRDPAQIADTAPGNAQTSRIAAYCRFALDCSAQAYRRAPVDDQGLSRCRRHSGGVKVLRGVHNARNRVPSRPSPSRLPEPSIGVDVSPGAVTIRRPAPWIAGDPGIPSPGIPHPGAILERVPSRTYQVGLPHHPVAGDVVEASVIVQVAGPVTVR